MSTVTSRSASKKRDTASLSSSPSSSNKPSSSSPLRERPQYSSALSDAVLAFLTLYAASQLWVSSRSYRRSEYRIALWLQIATGALSLIGVAAAVGTLRFAGVFALRSLHDTLARLGGFVSMPTLGLIAIFAFTSVQPTDTLPTASIAGLFAAFLVFSLFPRALKALEEPFVTVTSLFGILCLFFRAAFMLFKQSGSGSASATSAAWQGVIGAILVMVAGGIGTKGAFRFGPLSILRVDAFHYVLAFAHIALVHFFEGLWS